jgi:hypothetical protein
MAWILICRWPAGAAALGAVLASELVANLPTPVRERGCEITRAGT